MSISTSKQGKHRRNWGMGHLYEYNGNYYVRYREKVIRDGVIVSVQVSSPPLAKVKEVTKTKARELADEHIRGLRKKSPTPLGTQDVVSFVEGTYFPNVEKTLEPSTVNGYKQMWRAYLKARLFKVSLRDFRTVHGEQLMQEIAEEEKTEEKQPLSHLTLTHIKSFLSGVFKHAKRQGYIDGVNPMMDVSTPKGSESEPTYAYSLVEELQMLAALPAGNAQLVVALASFSGLSKSELRGLDWSDYDGEWLEVKRKIWRKKVGKPKTPKRRAGVPVIPQLGRYLESEKKTAGWVLADQVGAPLNIDYLARLVIIPTLKAHNIVWYGWHAFRRGLATNLKELGVDDLVIQQILRHSDVGVTRRNYIKTRNPEVVAAMQKLGQTFAAMQQGTIGKQEMN